jgi:trimeric autotransporter adhesin
MKNDLSYLTRHASLLILAFLSTLNLQLSTYAQGTAFTYQGRLNDNGGPANGTYDLRFVLYSDPSGGSQVGPILTNAATAIANGLFTVTLDFGSGVFISSDRWLEISLRTNGVGAFTTLTPRQPITPTPYAIFSAGAGTVNGGVIENPIFFGTTGNTPLNFVVNNGRALRLEPTINSVNVIGGFNGNNAASSIEGATIGGGGTAGYVNRVTGGWGTVGGGYANVASNLAATVSGGGANAARGLSSTVAGGYGNVASNQYAVVSGGYFNLASGDTAVIAGGVQNVASNSFAVISGGAANVAGGFLATVSGGQGNLALANNSTIVGGLFNTNNGVLGFVGGGWANNNVSFNGMIGGGGSNVTYNSYATVGGGLLNQANADYAFVGGGSNNVAMGPNDTVAGGFNNTAWGSYGGGGDSAAVAGGYQNKSYGNNAVVAGGAENFSRGNSPFIGGGQLNSAFGNFSVVGGGYANTAISTYSFIGSGYFNMIQTNGSSCAIAGGYGNSIQTNVYYATIGGGIVNSVSGDDATISGGYYNTNFGLGATISGGVRNIASGSDATVPGGFFNTASGDFSFAAGQRAKANHTGAFVWGDSTAADFASTGADQFLIRASGGVGIGTTSPASQLDVAAGFNGDGIHLIGSTSGPRSPAFRLMDAATSRGLLGLAESDGDFSANSQTGDVVLRADTGRLLLQNSGGAVMFINNNGAGIGRVAAANALEVAGNASKTTAGSWLANSDARIKTDIEPVAGALDRLSKVRLVSFRYTDGYRARHPEIENRPYLNIIAQEFREVFPDDVKSSGETLPGDGEAILQADTYPLTIYSAAAIQELNAKLEVRSQKSDNKSRELEQRLEQKETEFAEVKQRLEKLERLLEEQNNTKSPD